MQQTHDTTASVKLTIEWGERNRAWWQHRVELSIAAESGLVLVVPGLLIAR
jgi:hypothetical protein